MSINNINLTIDIKTRHIRLLVKKQEILEQEVIVLEEQRASIYFSQCRNEVVNNTLGLTAEELMEVGY